MQSRRKAQESLRVAFPSLLISLVISLVLMTGTVVHALEVAVSYSFPQVGEYSPPPSEMVEGSIIATFTGDAAMEPAGGPFIPQQINETTWTLLFTWNWTEPVSLSFVDSSEDTVTVVAAPQPVIPFGSQSHDLMTFHLTTATTNLWHPTSGIYVYGDFGNYWLHGVEWERSAQLDFFNPADQSTFSEPIGLRIHGGWSRQFSQKALRFYFDDFGSSNDLVYNFFDGEPTTFQRLLLRTHRFPFNCFNSDLLEGIWLDQGHLGSRMQPAVAYINNEFWGVYSLRERLDDEFLEVTHGLAPDSYIFIKDGIVEQGDPNDWANIIASFAEPQPFDSHAWFADMAARIDLNTYVDWLLINIFAATADNGFDANLAQLKEGDGPWKFIMWDEDDTLFPENLNSDHFRFYSSEDQAAFEANFPPVFYYNGWDPTLQPWCNMFHGFMQNSEFKMYFFDRLQQLLETELSPPAIAARIDAMVAEQGPEMDLHAQRWNWDSVSEYTDHAEALKSFTTARHEIVEQQGASFKEQFRVPVELVGFEVSHQDDGVHLTWETRGERGNQGFMVMRDNPHGPNAIVVDMFYTNPNLVGAGDTDELTQYSTVDAAPGIGEMNQYYLIWFDQMYQGHTLNWQESLWVDHWDGLVFNELMADNDTTFADGAGQFDDWVEIFNGSEVTVNLDSLFVTDDAADPTQHQLIGGLQLDPGQHLLLWADASVDQGSDHLGFRLSAAGEGIYLFAPDGETLVTFLEFGPQVRDVSFARESDGSLDWVYSAVPTAAAANGDPQTQTLLRLNELEGINCGLAADEMGEFDPWLELFNPLPVPIQLNNLELKLTGISGGGWTFQEQEILPGHKLLWLDGQPQQGLFHAPYVFTVGSGTLELVVAASGQQIDYLEWAEIPLTGSLARVPDGVGPWQAGVQQTPELPNPQPVLTNSLRINEFMALNGSVIADETGVFEDWVEIFNPGSETVALGEMFLTDDLAVPTRWAFPDTFIGPGEYMIIWCDSDPLDGPLHTNFKLSGIGESIGLYANVEEVIAFVDGYTFGPQELDVSEGRTFDGRDGRDGWEFFDTPSPGAVNSAFSAAPPGIIQVTGLLPNFPNPFNPSTTIVFALERGGDVHLAVHDLRGRLVALLVHEWQAAGQHQVVWDGVNKSGSPVASGVYLVRLKVGSVQDSRRVLLLK